MTIQPLAQVLVAPLIASLPKVDLHLHQEARARLDRIAARRRERPAYDWQSWGRRLLDEYPPGFGRLVAIYEPDKELRGVSDADPENFITRVVDVLEEAAADGEVLVEVRFGTTEAPSPPDLMPLFREAESRVRERHPRLHAEAIVYLGLRGAIG